MLSEASKSLSSVNKLFIFFLLLKKTCKKENVLTKNPLGLGQFFEIFN